MGFTVSSQWLLLEVETPSPSPYRRRSPLKDLAVQSPCLFVFPNESNQNHQLDHFFRSVLDHHPSDPKFSIFASVKILSTPHWSCGTVNNNTAACTLVLRRAAIEDGDFCSFLGPKRLRITDHSRAKRCKSWIDEDHKFDSSGCDDLRTLHGVCLKIGCS